MENQIPNFRVELVEFLANNGIDANGNPFNFGTNVTVASGVSWTGRVVMSTTVEGDKDIHLFTTNLLVSVPPSVPVKSGASTADFLAPAVGQAISATDVVVIASFDSFFPAPALMVTFHVIPPPK